MKIDLTRIELLDIKVMIENTLIDKHLDVDHQKDLLDLKLKIEDILNQ